MAKFESLHKDHDGTLDMKELASAKIDKKTFAKADVDNDHTLDQKEYPDGGRATLQSRRYR
ncbi:hypothetical protein ACU4GD_31555 [Cupriavidus basilensis]